MRRADREEIIERWCRALESGEYKQGKGYLCEETDVGPEFCCLGVLCDVMGVPYTVFNDNINGGRRVRHYAEEEYSGTTGLPTVVLRELKIRNSEAFYENPNTPYTPTSLALINDRGASFTEIARLIRSRPRGLFVE